MKSLLTFSGVEVVSRQPRPGTSRHQNFPRSNPQILSGVRVLPGPRTPFDIMPKFIDLTGQKFGLLTVVARVEPVTKNPRWTCRCECGTVKDILTINFKHGTTRSCGCVNSPSLVGQRFRNLTVVERVYPNTPTGKSRWACRCDCGGSITVAAGHLKSGHTSSCGCLLHIPKFKHGHARSVSGKKESSEYRSWCGMLQRTLSSPEGTEEYNNYRGRGITVCERWKVFENFLEDMGPKPTLKHTIERVDNNKGYCAKNCKWATMKEQAQNTRRNVYLTYKGETKCVSEWTRIKGFRLGMLLDRNRRGYTVEEAFEKPIRNWGR